MRVAAIIVMFAVAFAAAAQESQSESASLPSIKLPAELDRVLRDYETAWQARDAAGLAKLFSGDGYVLSNGRPPVRGRNAIAAAYAGAGGPLSLRAIGYGLEGSTGYIIGGYASALDAPDIGKFVLVVTKSRTGRWDIVADIDNANRRPSASPPTN